MKRNGIIINAGFKKIGKRISSWGCSGMNWAPGASRDELVSRAKKIRASNRLCEVLGKSYAYHVDQFDGFETQSGVTALINAIDGDHTLRIAMMAQQS